VEGELPLQQLAAVDVAIPEHHGPHAIDDLGQVGHREDHPVRAASIAAVGLALVDELRSRDERVPRVVYARRIAEVARIEVAVRRLLDDLRGALGVWLARRAVLVADRGARATAGCRGQRQHDGSSQRRRRRANAKTSHAMYPHGRPRPFLERDRAGLPKISDLGVS
jgi:hypothetical protein